MKKIRTLKCIANLSKVGLAKCYSKPDQTAKSNVSARETYSDTQDNIIK